MARTTFTLTKVTPTSSNIVLASTSEIQFEKDQTSKNCGGIVYLRALDGAGDPMLVGEFSSEMKEPQIWKLMPGTYSVVVQTPTDTTSIKMTVVTP